MDFNLNEEQQMLADTLTRWLAADYDADSRRKLVATPVGFSERNWQQLAELGLLGLNVPEAHGGLGAGATETLIVMQAFGRALLAEPYLPTAVMAVDALTRSGSASQQAMYLPRIVAGEGRFALAALEPGARYDLWRIESTATPEGGGFWLTGRKAVVLQGAAAHHLLVTARLPGSADSGTAVGGASLFIVDATASGLRLESYPTIDGLRSAEVHLDRVQLPAEALLGDPGQGLAIVERMIERGIAALCAEAVGAMERLIELTAEHLRTRRQFGQPIAGFQALQHRLADMLTATEQARSMALYAAARVDDADAAARRRALSAAKTIVGQSGRLVGESAVQLHGGMGMTDEYPVGHYFKRLVGIDLSFGDSAHHLERFGAIV